jgi:hypothetical protein
MSQQYCTFGINVKKISKIKPDRFSKPVGFKRTFTIIIKKLSILEP